MKIEFCQIDITGKCNLRCSYCRQSNEKDLDDDLGIVDYKNIFSQLQQMGCTRVSIAGGEPLMSNNFFEIIKMGKKMIGDVSILTNGTLLSNEIAKRMEPYVSMIQVSLDARTPELHDKIRGQKLLWDRTVAGIRNAINANIPTSVRITMFQDNKNEAIPLMEWAKTEGAYSFLARRVVTTGKGIDTKKIPAKELQQIFKAIVAKAFELDFRIGFGDPFPHLLLSPKRMKEADEDINLQNGCIIGGCSVSVDAMYIAQNGSVLLCPYLPIECGNISHSSIAEIWANSKAYKIARSIRHNLQGKCGDCKYKFACGGCRANAYYDTGSICGEDTGCWL